MIDWRAEIVMIGRRIPSVTFKTRVRDESIRGSNPFRWQDLHTDEIFSRKRIVLFSLPGAFTPVCTGEQCPAYEREYDAIRSLGIDEVYCLSVNDAFVMYQWARHLSITKLKLLPDGSGQFTRRMGMLINKEHLGFGYRSWRYSMVVHNGTIEQFYQEPGINDIGSDNDPYTITAPNLIIEYLRNHRSGAISSARNPEANPIEPMDT
ncbi:MAG TPA: peroxiredoxin [Steroidobacteraceae bacterium]|jgi:peroxiredoxin